ncbi:helix-turn-helix domain-containing protein [Synechococcus sp. PCC 6312]|uniref:helix-turn-helix domain-containing protein n=1 Tax=Synechococcus sp. (strain ATCC 27167 / PCC 6312) TaxID=195253 RepID=UPI00352899AC
MRGTMTQRELSQLLGVSQSAIQMWESQGSLPSLENLARIASYRKETTESLVAYLFARPLESQATTVMEQVSQMSMLELGELSRAISDRMFALLSK